MDLCHLEIQLEVHTSTAEIQLADKGCEPGMALHCFAEPLANVL